MANQIEHEHLAPQIDELSLQQQMFINYKKAQIYYEARKKQFINQIEQQLKLQDAKIEKGVSADAFFDFLDDSIKQYMPTAGLDGLYKILNTIFYSSNPKAEAQKFLNNQGSVSRRISKTESETILINKTPEGIVKLIELWGEKTGGEYTNLWTYLNPFQVGQLFEGTLLPDLLDKIGGYVGNIAYNNIVKNIVNTGNYKSKSAIISGKKNIRPDFLYVESIESLVDASNNENIDYSTYKNLNIELSELVDIEKIKNILHSKILKNYLSLNDGFGLQAKAWSKESLINKNRKKLMESSVMQKNIQQIFDRRVSDLADPKSHEHTWEPSYAVSYVSYYLSKFLINILNPMQVCFILSDGIYWFSDFLEENYLYMEIMLDDRVNWNRHEKNFNTISRKTWNKLTSYNIHEIRNTIRENSNQMEGEPRIRDSNIYINNYSRQTFKLSNLVNNKLETQINQVLFKPNAYKSGTGILRPIQIKNINIH